MYKIKKYIMKNLLLIALSIIGICSCNSNQFIPAGVTCNAYYYTPDGKIREQQITLRREWSNFWQANEAFVSVGEQKIYDVKKCNKWKASNELEQKYQYMFVYNGTWCYFDDVHKLFKYSKKLR